MPAPPEAKLIPLRKASSFGDNDKYGGGDGMPSFSAEKFHKKLAITKRAYQQKLLHFQNQSSRLLIKISVHNTLHACKSQNGENLAISLLYF